MDAVRRWPWYVVPLSIFAVTRIIDAVLLLLIGREQIAASDLPRDMPVPTLMDPPSYWHLIANWDGQWYRLIAEHGYPEHLPMLDGVIQQSQWAFYPGYPALVRLVMVTGAPFGVAASVVSLVCGAGSMCLLYRMVSPTAGGFSAALTVLALCTYPAAATFQAAYSESLALLLALSCLWCLRERRYALLLALALSLSLTRPIVLPVALLGALHWISRWRRRDIDPFPLREAVGSASVMVTTALSFFLWPAITAAATGRLDGYFVTAGSWYAEDDHSWPSWLLVFARGGNVALMVVVVVTVGTLGWVLVRASAKLWGLELRLWAFAYPLYLLGSTRPTTSVFRYAMLAAVPWWPFPEVGDQVRSTRSRLVLASLVLVIGVSSQFFWLRWYFTITLHSLSYP